MTDNIDKLVPDTSVIIEGMISKLIESKEINFWVLRFKNFLLGVCCDNRTNFGYLKMRLAKVRAKTSIE